MDPHPKFGSDVATDAATHTHQNGIKMFITYIIGVCVWGAQDRLLKQV